MFDDSGRPLSRRKVEDGRNNRIIWESHSVLLFYANSVLEEDDGGVSRVYDWSDPLGHGTGNSFAANYDVVIWGCTCRYCFFAASNDVWPEVYALTEDGGVDNEAIFLRNIVVGAADSGGSRSLRKKPEIDGADTASPKEEDSGLCIRCHL